MELIRVQIVESSIRRLFGFPGRLVLPMVIVVLCLGFGGCNRSSSKTNSEVAEESNSEPETSAEETGLATDLFQLMKLAEKQNADQEYDQAFETWRKIHAHVSNKYGLDAWQTISAELSMNAARQRTVMSAADQQQSAELTRLNALATYRIDKNEFKEARLYIEKAAGISTRLWGKESYVTANVNFIRAQCYFGLGMNERAIAVLKDVLTLRTTLTGENHPDVEATLEILAEAYGILGDKTNAEFTLFKLHEVSRELWGENSEVYAIRLNDLGVALNNNGKPLQALEDFHQVVQIRSQLFGDRSIQVAHARLNKGMAHARVNQVSEARSEFELAYELFHKHEMTLNDPSWVSLLDQMGTLALVEKDNLQAQKYFSELTELWKTREGDGHLEYGKSLFKLSVCIGNQGKYQEAETIMKRAITIFEDNLGTDSKLLHQPLTTYARLLDKLGGVAEAQRIRDRAVRLAGFQELPK